LKFDLGKKTLGNTGGMNQYPPLNERKIFDDDLSVKDNSSLERVDKKYPLDSNRVNMNIYVPEFYKGPPLDTYLSNSLNPYANDYRFYGSLGVTDRSWISTYSAKDTYLTIGSVTNISAAYNYMISDNFSLSAGTYGSKYNLNGLIQNDMGFNAKLKYDINDRLSIHAFGQYSVFARKHGLDATDRWGMINTTNYGGAFEYKITDRFGLMGGMSRELNPMTGKWKNVPFLIPVFYSK